MNYLYIFKGVKSVNRPPKSVKSVKGVKSVNA